MREFSIGRILFGAVVVSGLLTGGGLPAQDSEARPRGGELRRFSSTYQSPLWLSPYRGGPMVSPVYPTNPYYQGYFGTPWYVPQTRMYKQPVPQYEFPKLGLQHLYPYAYQFGIQVPPETDQPWIGDGDEAVANPTTPHMAEATALLRAGKYADAGRVLSRDLRDEGAPPELYLLIAEALLGAGKPQDAEIVFRHAIEAAPSLDFLDRADVAGDFPSRDVLKEKALAIPAGAALLRGTFLILAGEREKGVEHLRGLIQGKNDAAAKKVYLHFLGSAFGEPETADSKPEKKAEAATPPPPPPGK